MMQTEYGTKGWIKLHRELLSNPIWKNSSPEQKVILIVLLLKANHAEANWEWQGHKFVCRPGQMITSTQSILEDCGRGISEKNIRTAIARFIKMGFLAQEVAHSGRLITIENWAHYQGDSQRPGSVTAKKRANVGQADGTLVATNNNEIIIRTNEKIKKIYDDLPTDLIDSLIDFEESRNKMRKPMTNKAMELLITKLQKMTNGDTQKSVQLLNTAIESGWQTVYEPKEESPKGKKMINFMDIEG